MKISHPTLLIICLCFCMHVRAQFDRPKFGKVDAEDFQLTRYEKDTSAEALILFDHGYTHFVLNTRREFQLEHQRHFRIKIFKKGALHLADFKMRLHKGLDGEEKLNDVKACSYNLVNGKVVKTKLGADNIFTTETKRFVDKRMALPEVREGSIIEIIYTITSDFLYNFKSWQFQHKYPALWSQYKFVIPEYFTYHQSSKGYLAFDVNDVQMTQETFTVHFESQLNVGTAQESRSPSENYELKAGVSKAILTIKDVPAFVSEPNIDCEDNYMQSVEFELSSFRLPGQLGKNYSETWEAINNRMMNDEDFGDRLKTANILPDQLMGICAKLSTEKEKAGAIYSYIQKNVKWDEHYTIWAAQSMRDVLRNKSGNSSDINLLLVQMLRSAGLKADPVLLSTRDNGLPNTHYPSVSKFNSVLCVADLDGMLVLMDATCSQCACGVLPANDLNDNGRVVDDSGGSWLKLESNEKYREYKTYKLKLGQDGKLDGLIVEIFGGYAGIEHRDEFAHEKTIDDYMRHLQEDMPGLNIKKYVVSNLGEKHLPVSDSLNVEITDRVEVIGDKMLFKPLLFEAMEKNRFTLEERKYPIDNNYPLEETYIFEYEIPEGYIVESLPANAILKLDDNSFFVSYSVQAVGGKLMLIYKKSVNRIKYMPDEYPYIKELYNQLVAKHAEMIILKRAS